MDWYFPITIIPGIALLILSTTNLISGLNLELSQLAEENSRYEEIIDLKIKQLKRISRAVFWFYMGVFLFLISGMGAALTDFSEKWPQFILLAGVLSTTLAIILLLVFSIKAVRIRIQFLELKKKGK